MTRLAEIKKRRADLDMDDRGWFAERVKERFDAHAPSDIEWLLSELEKAETVAKAALNMHQQCEAQNTRMREALEALVWRYEEVVRDPDLECSLSVGLEDFDLVNARKELGKQS